MSAFEPYFATILATPLRTPATTPGPVSSAWGSRLDQRTLSTDNSAPDESVTRAVSTTDPPTVGIVSTAGEIVMLAALATGTTEMYEVSDFLP